MDYNIQRNNADRRSKISLKQCLPITPTHYYTVQFSLTSKHRLTAMLT